MSLLLLAACGEPGEPSPLSERPEIVLEGPSRPGRPVLTGELVVEKASIAVAPVVRIWPLQVRWLATNGSKVEAEERIMEFDNAQLISRLEDQRSAIVSAESQLDQVRARVATEESAARLDVLRQRSALQKAELFADLPTGLASTQEVARRDHDLEAAQLRFEQSEIALQAKKDGGAASTEAARLALGEARARLKRTEFELERLVLRAPSSGVLLIGDSRAGSTLRVGDQAWPGTTVARIPDLSTLRVQARLFDVDDGIVKAGQRALIALDAFPDEILEGTVSQIEQVAQPVGANSDRRAFGVVVEVEGLDPDRMRHGMSVKVEVQLSDSDESPRMKTTDLAGGTP